MESNDHSCIGEGDRHYLARTDGETERQNIEQSDIETQTDDSCATKPCFDEQKH